MHRMKRTSYFSKKGTYYYMKRVRKIVHYQNKWLGNGIVIVVMDTGVSSHPDLKGRILLFRDFVNGRYDMYDDNGHGTHVCGVISGRRIGMAPESKLIVLKVLDEEGNGRIESSMRAFRWILENQEKYNIRMVNISMGMKPHTNEQGERYILGAVELLWSMGIVVIAAAGNLGPAKGSITIPGISDKIITVGSSDHAYSGRGSLEKNMRKPALVAPGNHILSCNYRYEGGKGVLYVAKSGTSMSTPIVSGAAAGLLSKFPNMTNSALKKRLKESCDDLGMSPFRQGNGLLNVQKLLK